MGAENNNVGKFEKATWPWLRDLAQNCPEAGIHFLRKQITSNIELELISNSYGGVQSNQGQRINDGPMVL